MSDRKTLWWCSVVFSLAALCGCGPFGGRREVRDGFADPGASKQRWRFLGLEWVIEAGACRSADAERSFAILSALPHARKLSLEATIQVSRAVSKDWKVAGLAVVRDERNFWHLALVEAPERQGRRHFVELCEMLDGTWLAQNEPGSRLEELPALNADFRWEYGKRYRLRLDLSPGLITGSVMTPDGKVLTRRGFKLAGRAVASGRAALTNAGFEVAFDDVAVRSELPMPPPKTKKTVPPYTTAGRVPLPDEPRGKATGFFHVEKIGGRWWVIDPKGRPFYIIGTDHANYRVHWCEKLGYAPYHRNMVKLFNGDEGAWAASTAERLLAWGFNSLGANHSPSLRHRGLAWMAFAAFGTGFAGISDICPKTTWTGFPDVFDPRFERYCDLKARRLCAPHKEDPWLLGYFLDNELEWYGKEHRPWSLVDEVFKKPATSHGKQALIAFLKKRYPTIEELNEAWGTKAESYEALARATQPLRHRTERGRRDKLDFLALIAEKYFSTATAAIRRHDPNHMVLGCRFAGSLPPGVARVAGKYCDIFSINCYRWVDLETGEVRGFERDLARWHEETGRPLMITEWSFPALDSGLPCKHGAGQRFDTQAQRAKAFTIFQRLLFATPFVVGSDYFMWVDEPALGISSTFPEDTNYGLVDVNNRPYEELVEAASRLNPKVYQYHSGRTAELSTRIVADPLRVVVTNGGKLAAATELETTINGRPRRQPLRLGPGQTVEVPVPGRGVRFIRAVADPDGALPEVRRADNAATYLETSGAAPARRVPRTFDDELTRLTIVVANTGSRPLENVPVDCPLAGVPQEAVEKAGGATILWLSTEAKVEKEVAGQVDRLPDGARLAFTAPRLEAFTARQAVAVLRARPPQATPAVAFERKGNRWKADNGAITLVKSRPGGNAFDEVLLGGRQLGLFVPLIWQDVGQNLWPRPEAAKLVAASNGPVRLVLDIEFDLRGGAAAGVRTAVDQRGRFAPVLKGPGAFRTRYRFVIYAGKPWFSSRLLWLENTDARRWTFLAYFHYALSKLAGDASDDVVGGPDVPNYYLRERFAMWSDPRAGLHYGICVERRGDLDMFFWKDAAGNEHADVRRHVGLKLEPGQRYAAPQPPGYVFGAAGKVGERPWKDIVDEVAALASVVVKVIR